MNTRTAWIVYSLLRLLFFAAPYAALYLIGWPWWLAAIIATLVAVSLSVLFLHRPRAAAAEGIYEWRNRGRTADDVFEDEAIDEAAETDADDANRADEESGVGSESSETGTRRDS